MKAGILNMNTIISKIDIKNSVYSISNYMRQIQRLFDSNILRDWNEDIISIQKKVSGT